MRKAILALALFLVAGSAFAGNNWYFSDCATGGTGVISNPYCLNPDGDGDRDSFAYLADGSGFELAAGDTVNLCCGACDGSAPVGGCIYRVQESGTLTGGRDCHDQTGYFFHPLVTGTSQQPITIQNYPGEIVTVQGMDEANGLGVDAGDVTIMIMNRDNNGTPAANPGFYVLKGNSVGGQKGLRFKRAKRELLCASHGTSDMGGFPGWTIDGVDFSESDPLTWGVTAGIGTVGAGCGSASQGPQCMYLARSSGALLIKNSVFHACCGTSAIRNIVGAPHNATLTVEDTEFYDAACGVETWDNSHVTMSRLNIHDVWSGIQVEDRSAFITIEDSTIACLGQVFPSADGRCDSAIRVDDGNNDDGTDTFNGKFNQTHDITIRRNKVYETNLGNACLNSTGGSCASGQSPCTCSTTGVSCGNPTPACAQPARGKYIGAIYWSADCLDSKGCTDISGLIENNFVWNIQPLFGGRVLNRSGIGVQANKPITVQHNTVQGTRYPMQLEGECGSSACSTDVIHVVKDNTLADCGNECILVFPDASRAGITYNNAKAAGSAASIADCPSTTGDGTGTAESCSAAAINPANCTQFPSAPGVGIGNRCQPSSFQNAGGIPIALRDFHLTASDAGNINVGTAGALFDYDGESRSDPPAGVPDIGADEARNFLADPGFESGSIDGPWRVPVGDFNSTPISARIVTGSQAIVGSKAIAVTTGPTLEGLCFGCRYYAPFQTATGLTVGATYGFSGSWKILSGTADANAKVTVGAYSAVCDGMSVCPLISSCSVNIGGPGTQGTFHCESLVVAPSTSIDIGLAPNTAPEAGRVDFVFDGLRLYYVSGP